MDLWIKFINVVTVGNLSTIAGIICALVYFYYKVRRYLAMQQVEFIKYLESLTSGQTTQIEKCIHGIPGHPESLLPPPPSDSQLNEPGNNQERQNSGEKPT